MPDHSRKTMRFNAEYENSIFVVDGVPPRAKGAAIALSQLFPKRGILSIVHSSSIKEAIADELMEQILQVREHVILVGNTSTLPVFGSDPDAFATKTMRGLDPTNVPDAIRALHRALSETWRGLELDPKGLMCRAMAAKELRGRISSAINTCTKGLMVHMGKLRELAAPFEHDPMGFVHNEHVPREGSALDVIMKEVFGDPFPAYHPATYAARIYDFFISLPEAHPAHPKIQMELAELIKIFEEEGRVQ